MGKILIIDDDLTFNLMLKTFLVKNGFETVEAKTAKEGLMAVRDHQFALILSDLRLPDIDGIELLKSLKRAVPDIPVILMTGFAGIKTAVKAIKLGALDYITKPINPDEVLLLIENATTEKPAQPVVAKPKAKKDDRLGFISGKSPRSVEINEYIKLVAPTNMSVIVEGESGTGKEYVSRMIHQQSKRAEAPFIAIDCGALPKDLAGSELFGHLKGAFTGAVKDKTGQFEAAHGGTLFLDEIGNLPYEIQVQLLRAIQERTIRRLGGNNDIEIDVRIIAATNEDLKNAVAEGAFREDLYHRLNEFKIALPPLRARDEDIKIFAQHFLELANEELEKSVEGFSKEGFDKLLSYPWPGNLRELKNAVKRAVLLATQSEVLPVNLPSEVMHYQPGNAIENGILPTKSQGLRAITEQKEKEMILETLEKVRYNKSRAAKLLNIDRKTLYNKLKQYDIEA